MITTDVYLYGMTLLTTSHLLKEKFPEADDYAEINMRYQLPGGETGTCATVLNSLGLSIRMDGNHLGRNTYEGLEKFYRDTQVDLSSMTYDANYEGLEDYVFIDKDTRTCFGTFQYYFSNQGGKRWNEPKEEDIQSARVIGLDPFFFEQSEAVAKYCHKHHKKYVIIDCKYDSLLHRYSEVNVISNEYIRNNYKDTPIEKLFKEYTSRTDGLVIFTFGSQELIYGRTGETIKRFKPYDIEVTSTLGAGDSFKAGAVYALHQEMSDEELVAFASATAGSACMHFPIPLNPPTLEKIQIIQASKTKYNQ